MSWITLAAYLIIYDPATDQRVTVSGVPDAVLEYASVNTRRFMTEDGKHITYVVPIPTDVSKVTPVEQLKNLGNLAP